MVAKWRNAGCRFSHRRRTHVQRTTRRSSGGRERLGILRSRSVRFVSSSPSIRLTRAHRRVTSRILYGSISSMSYLADGSLVVSAEDRLFMYSSKFLPLPSKSIDKFRKRVESVEVEPVDSHAFAAGRMAPLPWHHPQLLFQSLLTGQSHPSNL